MLGGRLGLLVDLLNLTNPMRRSRGRGGLGCPSGVKNFPRPNEDSSRATEHARWWKGRVSREFREEEGEVSGGRGKGTLGSWGRLTPMGLGLRGVPVGPFLNAVWPCGYCCVTLDVLLKHSELNVLSKIGLISFTAVVVRIKRDVE